MTIPLEDKTIIRPQMKYNQDLDEIILKHIKNPTINRFTPKSIIIHGKYQEKSCEMRVISEEDIWFYIMYEKNNKISKKTEDMKIAGLHFYKNRATLWTNDHWEDASVYKKYVPILIELSLKTPYKFKGS